MKLLVFGASGAVGRRLCRYAVSDGHAVTAFVRDRAAAPSGVAAVAGDVTDTEAVDATVADADAVYGALGTDDGVTPTRVDSVVTSMERHAVDRLVAVATAGILQATPSRLRLDTVEFPDRLDAVASAHNAVYARLRESALDWTLACPPQMPDGPPTNHYRVTVDYLPDGGQSISTGDVAAFCYGALVDRTHLGERVGLAY